MYLMIVQYKYVIGIYSLVPRPPPRFYLHGCEIKSGRRPWDEAKISTHECVLTPIMIQLSLVINVHGNMHVSGSTYTGLLDVT